jgi:hypothetical protein
MKLLAEACKRDRKLKEKIKITIEIPILIFNVDTKYNI